MDPNAALSAMRRAEQTFDDAARDHGKAWDEVFEHGRPDDAGEERAAEAQDRLNDAAQGLRDGFEALDRWLTTGGFLPHAWEPAQRLDGVRLARLIAHGLNVASRASGPSGFTIYDNAVVAPLAARIAQVVAAVDTMERVRGQFVREGTDFDVDAAMEAFRTHDQT